VYRGSIVWRALVQKNPIAPPLNRP
jgi:hypothetical protein